MRGKRFRGQRHWHNTIAWVRVSVLVVLAALLFTVASGNKAVLLGALGLVTISILVAVVRDRGKRCLYVVDDETVRLTNGRDSLDIRISDLQDATLVDRSAAREYIQQRSRAAVERGTEKSEIAQREREFTRFCGVDIGLRSWSFGLGRRMIDRMPEARHDLVLLRSRNGVDHLLSPVYNQDMIGTIAKAKATERRA